VHERLARCVEEAHVHRFHVKIDPAIVAMLTVVESHSVLLCAERAFIPAQADWWSVGAQEEGLNKHQPRAADGRRREQEKKD
jgi:hypothetical protein